MESETIFWVHGPAGTGKSTISRTVARDFKANCHLAASYFFKRGEKGRNDTSLFFPTIASELAKTIPGFRSRLSMSLESLGDDNVENKALEEQFETLILTPLSTISHNISGVSTKVIVIDALDECERYNDIPLICSLLSRLKDIIVVRLRVFLTSRLAHQIVAAFEDIKNNGTAYRDLALDQEFHEETKADISAFLEARFTDIKAKMKIRKEPWPDGKDLKRLVDLATSPSPLFIYAATLYRFVYDERGRKSPIKQLNIWLQQCDSNKSQLTNTYEPVLRQVLLGDEEGQSADPLDNDDRLQLLLILGSIVLLATPLPAPNLAALLEIDEDIVNFWLRNLHAVLSIPDDYNAPVRLLHKSFSDFLLGQEGTGTAEFRVDAVETHAILVSKCLQRMNSDNGLRKDKCNIREPGKLRDEIDKTIIVSEIPPDLEYACLYWVYHLQHIIESKDKAQLIYLYLQEIEAFLGKHFLHWIESMSLLGKLSDAILSIKDLLHIVRVHFMTSIITTKILILTSHKLMRVLSLPSS